MSKKVVILVEDELYKMEDMLLSIQSILFVAAKQKLLNAPVKNDTEICLLHVLDNDEKEDSKTFGRFKSILEDRQRTLITSEYEYEIAYKYEVVHIDTDLYPGNRDECIKIVSRKIREIIKEREYSIVLDVILVRNESKDTNQVLNDEKILSQMIYQIFPENCIPYTTYDSSGQTFRTKWMKGVGGKMPYERFCLDGNVIHKKFKQEIYSQLKIGS